MNNNCPICNCAIGNAEVEFCPMCSWELVSISDGASDALKSYYKLKLEKHKSVYEKLQIQDKKLQTQIADFKELKSHVSELNSLLDEARLQNRENEKKLAEKQELEQQLKYFTERYGASWLNGNDQKKSTTVIKWEIAGPMKFRFYHDDIREAFPDQIVMLLKKNDRPKADGDFNFAFMVNTASRQYIAPSCCELSLANNELQRGKYYIRFTNLNNNINNVIFFHKEQGAAPVFDWEKTTINI